MISDCRHFYVDIICDEMPPEIPHDSEYDLSLNKDDGRVFIEHFEYPEMTSPLNGRHLSAMNQSSIPRNFNTTLRYFQKNYYIKPYKAYHNAILGMSAVLHVNLNPRMEPSTQPIPSHVTGTKPGLGQ